MPEDSSWNSEHTSAEIRDESAAIPIVGIGASAGGLSALETFFEQMPTDAGAAYIVIQHLSPDYQSHMPELLARRTAMETLQMSEGLTPQANTIYFLPPGKHVILTKNSFHLQERVNDGELSLPIDRFFKSLAAESNRLVASIILSGTGSDGSNGIQLVASAGGLVLCQDESSAQFDGMPLNALRTGVVHLAGTVVELAESLTSFLNGKSVDEVIAEASPTIQKDELDDIYRLMASTTGVDFTQYKPGTFSRRLARRMMLKKVEDVRDYAKTLENDPTEAARLGDDLLIGVTRFFRDPEGFQRLQQRVIRPTLRSKSDGDELRIWVAGCATGQEAYSVAIQIFEELSSFDREIKLRIFATDVHPDAIRFAQRATYPNESLSEIPRHLREKYLVPLGESFQINTQVRDAVVFARHDVLQDPPFTNMDIVTCRNMLIYLNDDAQRHVLAAFTHALKIRGNLWLGPSETLGELDGQFASLDGQWRMFQKERDLRLPLDLKLRSRAASVPRSSLRPRSTGRTPSPSLMMSYDRILGMFAPPAILVDDQYQPIQMFGDLSNITIKPSGRLSGTVEDLIIEELRSAVSLSLQRLRLNHSQSESEVTLLGGRKLTVCAREFHHTSQSESHFLVTFTVGDAPGNDLQEALTNLTLDGSKASATDYSESTQNHLLQEQLRSSELELEYTRESLQATVEELETTNEELQSSNEELTSSNEELQSTNEELHSVNEELHAANAESERRVQLLSEARADLESVFRESNVGILLVDSELMIRHITPMAADMLGVSATAAERQSFHVFNSRFPNRDVLHLIAEAKEAEKTIELETVERRGDPILISASPYRDRSGTVLTFTNLRSVKESAEKLQKLTSIVSDSTDAIIGLDLNAKMTSWNRGATRLFGLDLIIEDPVPIADYLPSEVAASVTQMVRRLVRDGEVEPTEIATQLLGHACRLLVRVTPVLDEDRKVASAAVTIYDVTSLREAEDELRLRTHAIDSASNGIIIVDAKRTDMPIIYSNRGFEEMTGFGQNEIQGRNCRFLQGPKTDPNDVRLIREGISSGDKARVTILNYRRDGSTFYNELLISPVTDEQGEITHFIGVQHDVTDAVVANQRVVESEHEYRSTFENAAVGIAHVGLDGQLLRVNRKFAEIIGCTTDEVEAKTFQEITFSGDLDKDLTHFSQMLRGNITGYTMEKRYLHKNGNLVWVNLTTSLRRKPNGEPDCCISLVEDITDRKVTERRLSESRAIITQVIENLNDVFISFDSSGIIRFANSSAEEFAEMERDSMIGISYEKLFESEPESQILSMLDRVRRSQKPESSEYLAPRLKRWFNVRVFPTDGGAALHMSDVTTRKETEVHLERARVAAEEASHAKTQFLTNMSHEIRSPMSAILGFSDIALRELRRGQQVDPANLETVIRNGRFLLRVINDILDLSKVEAGKLDIRRSRFRLLPMLADVSELMRHRSNSLGVPLKFTFANQLPESIVSDRSRLEQILVNLIGNAIKFSPGGDVEVVIGFDPTQECLKVEVIDTGIGISSDNLNRLFQTFSQVHGERLVGVEGTGLGLVISKRLASLLDGDIEVQSVEGKGSTFTLKVPIGSAGELNLVEATEDDLKPEEKIDNEIGEIKGHVLVADDSRDVRLVTEHFLKMAKAQVTVVVNGAEAVNAVRDAEQKGQPFDCILMDMQMPEMDGRQATRAIREKGFTMPIIALTAGATSDEVQETLNAGCTQFVSKPVDGPKLIRRIAKLINSDTK